MTTLLEQLNTDMADVIDSVQHSLVQVSVGVGNGAGTIWHSDGLIVTNAHVVGEFPRNARGPRRSRGERGELSVTLPDGTTAPARILAQDAERDVAVLSVDAHDLPTIQLADSRKLRAGDWVFAVGHPWGVKGAASAGIVVGTGAEWPEMPTQGRDWIVISLKVRPGNSGGSAGRRKGALIGDQYAHDGSTGGRGGAHPHDYVVS